MWSYCYSGETATCMYNSPHEEESLPRVLNIILSSKLSQIQIGLIS